ncbi:hypothetical protein [Bifidobacterium actinocoloniiforme]|uniref:hypothetical protein n=1 Tax=Bifidobacterium actinocoloniiforme TaxID=638619 RepID=UPI000AB5196D|nr:hypothetical protein [Bifidobacterium actinocoloniiforme]
MIYVDIPLAYPGDEVVNYALTLYLTFSQLSRATLEEEWKGFRVNARKQAI